MLASSIRQPFGEFILRGSETIKYRALATPRASPNPGYGDADAAATLAGCVVGVIGSMG
jgi:hypothetical protein